MSPSFSQFTSFTFSKAFHSNSPGEYFYIKCNSATTSVSSSFCNCCTLSAFTALLPMDQMYWIEETGQTSERNVSLVLLLYIPVSSTTLYLSPSGMDSANCGWYVLPCMQVFFSLTQTAHCSEGRGRHPQPIIHTLSFIQPTWWNHTRIHLFLSNHPSRNPVDAEFAYTLSYILHNIPKDIRIPPCLKLFR